MVRDFFAQIWVANVELFARPVFAPTVFENDAFGHGFVEHIERDFGVFGKVAEVVNRDGTEHYIHRNLVNGHAVFDEVQGRVHVRTRVRTKGDFARGASFVLVSAELVDFVAEMPESGEGGHAFFEGVSYIYYHKFKFKYQVQVQVQVLEFGCAKFVSNFVNKIELDT